MCGGCGCGRSGRDWFPLCVLQRVVVPVGVAMRFLNLWLQIALEWLHDCRPLMLPRAYRYVQVCDVMLQNAL